MVSALGTSYKIIKQMKMAKSDSEVFLSNGLYVSILEKNILIRSNQSVLFTEHSGLKMSKPFMAPKVRL